MNRYLVRYGTVLSHSWSFLLCTITSADIDECSVPAMGSAVCHDNATCTNSPGSFTCACASGFSGNGTNCQSKDDTIILACRFYYVCYGHQT